MSQRIRKTKKKPPRRIFRPYDPNRYSELSDWTTREKLILSSAVLKHGRAWKKAAEILIDWQEDRRPPEWFTPANCCHQFNLLSDAKHLPPGLDAKSVAMHLVPELEKEYLAFLEHQLPLAHQKSLAKLKKLEALSSGDMSDKKVDELYEKFMDKAKNPVEIFSDNDEYTDVSESEDEEVEIEQNVNLQPRSNNKPSTSATSHLMIPAASQAIPARLRAPGKILPKRKEEADDDDVQILEEIIDISYSPMKVVKQVQPEGVQQDAVIGNQMELIGQKEIHALETQAVEHTVVDTGTEEELDEIVVIEEADMSQASENEEVGNQELVEPNLGEIAEEYPVSEIESTLAHEQATGANEGLEIIDEKEGYEGIEYEPTEEGHVGDTPSPQQSHPGSIPSSPERLQFLLPGEVVSPKTAGMSQFYPELSPIRPTGDSNTPIELSSGLSSAGPSYLPVSPIKLVPDLSSVRLSPLSTTPTKLTPEMSSVPPSPASTMSTTFTPDGSPERRSSASSTPIKLTPEGSPVRPSPSTSPTKLIQVGSAIILSPASTTPTKLTPEEMNPGRPSAASSTNLLKPTPDASPVRSAPLSTSPTKLIQVGSAIKLSPASTTPTKLTPEEINPGRPSAASPTPTKLTPEGSPVPSSPLSTSPTKLIQGGSAIKLSPASSTPTKLTPEEVNPGPPSAASPTQLTPEGSPVRSSSLSTSPTKLIQLGSAIKLSPASTTPTKLTPEEMNPGRPSAASPTITKLTPEGIPVRSSPLPTSPTKVIQGGSAIILSPTSTTPTKLTPEEMNPGRPSAASSTPTKLTPEGSPVRSSPLSTSPTNLIQVGSAITLSPLSTTPTTLTPDGSPERRSSASSTPVKLTPEGSPVRPSPSTSPTKLIQVGSAIKLSPASTTPTKLTPEVINPGLPSAASSTPSNLTPEGSPVRTSPTKFTPEEVSPVRASPAKLTVEGSPFRPSSLSTTPTKLTPEGSPVVPSTELQVTKHRNSEVGEVGNEDVKGQDPSLGTYQVELLSATKGEVDSSTDAESAILNEPLVKSNSTVISEIEEDEAVPGVAVIPEADQVVENGLIPDEVVLEEKMEEGVLETEEVSTLVDSNERSGDEEEHEDERVTSIAEKSPEGAITDETLDENSDAPCGTELAASNIGQTEDKMHKELDEVFLPSAAADSLEPAVSPDDNTDFATAAGEIADYPALKHAPSFLKRQSETSVDTDSERQGDDDHSPLKKKRKRGSRLLALLKEASTFMPAEPIDESVASEIFTRARRTKTGSANAGANNERYAPNAEEETVVVTDRTISDVIPSPSPTQGITSDSVIGVVKALAPKKTQMLKPGDEAENFIPLEPSIPSDGIITPTENQNEMKDKLMSTLDKISSMKEAEPLKSPIIDPDMRFKMNFSLDTARERIMSGEMKTFDDLKCDLSMMLLNHKFTDLLSTDDILALRQKIWSTMNDPDEVAAIPNEEGEPIDVPTESDLPVSRSRLSSTSSTSTNTPKQKGTKRPARSGKQTEESNKRGLRSSSASNAEMGPVEPFRNPNRPSSPSESPRPSPSAPIPTSVTRAPRKGGNSESTSQEATRDLRSRRSTRGGN